MDTIQIIKQLRTETDAPVGKCKEALEQSDWDIEAAKGVLRAMGQNSSRTVLPTCGAIFVAEDLPQRICVVVVKCETDFVAINQKFVDICNDVVRWAADTLPKLGEVDARLSTDTASFGEKVVVSEFANYTATKPREATQYYLHHDRKRLCVLRFTHSGEVPTEEQNTVARAVAMHIVATGTQQVPDLGEAFSDEMKQKWRDEATGKPEAVVEKIVEGKWNGWLKDNVLEHQVMFDGSKRVVGEVCQAAGVTVLSWASITT